MMEIWNPDQIELESFQRELEEANKRSLEILDELDREAA